MIDAARALIGWSYHVNGRNVGKVVVLEQPLPGQDATHGLGPREWQECHCTHGACWQTWLQGHPALTPEGVFADMLTQGFIDARHLVEALRQFAKIKECEWAKTMWTAITAGGWIERA